MLVVTGKKELADDKAVLLGNAHHGLSLLKLAAFYSLQDWGKVHSNFSVAVKIIPLPISVCTNLNLELLEMLHVYSAVLLCFTIKQLSPLKPCLH